MRLIVIDRSGTELTVEASPSGSLMEVLRDLEDGVAAICGGLCSCATCHVYIEPSWSARLDPPAPEECALVAELTHRCSYSRLACQVALSPTLDGLRVRLAPEE